MSYFITGTDTGVGKTLIGCALLQGFAASGRRVAGFKPVAAGVDADGMNDDAKALLATSNIPLSYGQVNPYCLHEAIAPHIAASHENIRIELPRIIAAYRELAAKADVVIVEGAGGFLVPLNGKQSVADLARELGLPVIIVVGMRLGCLNHALLTMKAVDDYGVQCAGWIANVLDGAMPALRSNIDALRACISAPLVGVVPYMAVPHVRFAAEQIDFRRMDN
ncbi:MAG TPA: dethiobiotin synthase [Gallionella sp.]|nr:dethiobiotin synthase [Gallionella sp.]